MADTKSRLREIRRRLGPYTALQGNEPFRQCDAEIARRLAELIQIVDELAEEVSELTSQERKSL